MLCVGLGIPYLLSYATHSIYVWYRYPALIYPAFIVLLVSGLTVAPRAVRWAATGVLLLIAYPTKALTNPVFYAKLTMIGFAVWILTKLQKEVFAGAPATEADMMARGAPLAKWSLALWVGAISAGRLLAYTFKYILYPF